MPPTTPVAGKLTTGVAGLDDILAGGLEAERVYLLEGTPGTGKTTLSLQFLLHGLAAGERALYVTLSETETELRAVATAHGWSLDGLDIFELVDEAGLDLDAEQTVLHPAELELGETTRGVMERVDATKPSRVVFDSLSELRLLAQSPIRYRRQVLALKHFFTQRRCTVLLLDDRTEAGGDQQLHSIAHGVVTLEQLALDYGAERRRLRVVKMRGSRFRGGYHDFTIERGGLAVHPRLVAGEHHVVFADTKNSTGSGELDLLLGGGLVPGTSSLVIGPSGAGKTTMAISVVVAALRRGEHAAYFLFDEGRGTFLARSANLGMDLRPYLDSGQLALRQIDPAEMSPGEFVTHVRAAVEQRGARVVVIDSLNAYLQSMPGEKFLRLQMHELLSYLNQRGVMTLMVLGQHGILGEFKSDVDLSYLSDTVIIIRYFEAEGELRKAVSVLKTRTSDHERTIREFSVDVGGVYVGATLRGLHGVLSGRVAWRSDPPLEGEAG